MFSFSFKFCRALEASSDQIIFMFFDFVAMASPRIGVGRLVRVIILRNDNASGIVRLSSSAVSVQEDNKETFLYVVRSGGDFGEVLLVDISCSFMIFSY